MKIVILKKKGDLSIPNDNRTGEKYSLFGVYNMDGAVSMKQKNTWGELCNIDPNKSDFDGHL